MRKYLETLILASRDSLHLEIQGIKGALDEFRVQSTKEHGEVRTEVQTVKAEVETLKSVHHEQIGTEKTKEHEKADVRVAVSTTIAIASVVIAAYATFVG